MNASDKHLDRADSIDGVVWKYDLVAGRYSYVGPQIERVLGYRPEDWLGKDWQFRLDHIHPDDRARVTEASREILWNCGQGELDYRFRASDGRYVRLHDTIALIGAWETTRQAVIVSVEIAAPALADQAQAGPMGAAGWMLQAQKMESIGMLAGGIAHDFNNILGAMLGFAELAASSASVRADAKLASYINEIRKSGLRGRDLVKQLLSFSRAGDTELARIDPGAMLGDFFRFVRATLASTYELRLSLPQDLPVIVGDAVQLHQVLLNLALNARDAQHGKGLIAFGASVERLSAGVCDSCLAEFSGVFLCLSVADAGPGLVPQTLEKMFQPFFTTKDAGQGSGLGLSIVHGIVHAHRGHIRALAGAGGGTELRIYLPLDETAPALDVSAVAVDADAVRRVGRVMLLDDDPALLWVMEEMLVSLGCAVEPYSNSIDGMAAIAAWAADPGLRRPDLLLTDLTMPFHDGIEVIRAVRAVYPECPALLMTGYGQRVGAANLRELDVTLLQKPIDLDELARAVSRCLAGRHGAA